jgi:hypothetical protein
MLESMLDFFNSHLVEPLQICAVIIVVFLSIFALRFLLYVIVKGICIVLMNISNAVWYTDFEFEASGGLDFLITVTTGAVAFLFVILVVDSLMS